MKKEEKDQKVIIGGFDVSEKHRDVVWPIFLIFLGGVFLLNSLSVIDWNIWGYLWRFWPVLLILGGLRMIVGHSRIGEIVIAFVSILIFGFIIFFVYTLYSTEYTISLISEDFTENFRERYGNILNIERDAVSDELGVKKEEYPEVEEIFFDMDIAATEFTMLTDSESEEYLSVDASYFENYGTPTLEEEYLEGVLELDFTMEFSSGGFRWGNDTPEYVLTFGDVDIPTTIDIGLGAGKGTMDLEELTLTSLNADIGAGELDVTLYEGSIASDEITFDIGAGDVTLTIPEDVSFVLTYTVGVGEIDFNGESIVSFVGDGTYKSPNYEDVSTILNIDVNVGAGAFHIKTN